MRKFLIYLFVLLLVIILAIIVSVRFFPKLYVSAFNHFSTDQITAEQIDINFVPLEVTIGNLGVINSQQATIATVGKAKFSAQVMAWFNNKQNFWKASVSNADVQLVNLPQGTSDTAPSNSAVSKINVHKILSGLDLEIDGAQIKIDDKQTIHVERLYTSLNDHDLSDYKLVEQDIEFAVSYFGAVDTDDSPLELSGVIQSRYVDGVSVLTLSVPSIDLSSVFQVNNSDAETHNPDSGVQVEKNTTEAAIDWQWLSLIEPLQIDTNVGEVSWSKSSVRNIDLTTKIDQLMSFSFKSDIAWLESDEISFEDAVQFTGEWQPISSESVGADLRGESTLTTSALNLKFGGDVNVNGTSGNKLLIELDSSKVPVQGLLDEQTQALVDQYFPIKTLFEVQQPSAQIIELQVSAATFGDSDLKGQVSLNTKPSGLLSIDAKLESMVFSYKGANNNHEANDGDIEKNKHNPDQAAPSAVVDKQEKSKKDMVFNDDVIDWSWLDGLLVEFDWKAKQVLVDDIEINDLHLPLSISEGALMIPNLEALLAGGKISSETSLIKKKGGVDIAFNLTASDVILEELKLLPPEELKKAVTDLSVTLNTNGQSARALAQSLDGKVLLNVGDGVIGNDSFELIGSDLILNLLNKLNPFAKKNETTKLECAVVNLNVEKGRVNIDKSLAIRTSKLTMVADGYVDLSSEKIKLSLTPKARQGIGVDVSSLVKFIALGGTLAKPAPAVTASGLVKSAVVLGAAVSTGGVSLLASSALEKTVAKADVCKRANNAFK